MGESNLKAGLCPLFPLGKAMAPRSKRSMRARIEVPVPWLPGHQSLELKVLRPHVRVKRRQVGPKTYSWLDPIVSAHVGTDSLYVLVELRELVSVFRNLGSVIEDQAKDVLAEAVELARTGRLYPRADNVGQFIGQKLGAIARDVARQLEQVRGKALRVLGRPTWSPEIIQGEG